MHLLLYFYFKELAEEQMEGGERVMVLSVHLTEGIGTIYFYLGFNN